jgi:hypothetical protein
MAKTARDRMSNAIRVWTTNLDNTPGWKAWRIKRIAHTLHFDDPSPLQSHQIEKDFEFSPEIEKQHAAVTQYLGLVQTIESLKECEYYFRRYPFRGLPVTHYSHITNVCEMYFGKFYEFKERMKNYFEAIKVVEPRHKLDIGKFIKLFEKIFDQELRTRNSVHHIRRFEDIAIDRVFLIKLISLKPDDRGWKREHSVAYRKVAGEWSSRVRKRAAKMDEILEAIAEATLSTCTFLTPSQS